MADDEISIPLGRGRGRGTPRPPDAREAGSSNSEKRQLPESNVFGHSTQKRGSTRYSHDIQSIVRTKPMSAHVSKEGTTGKRVQLKANYFHLIQKPTFEFNHYRVDFEPEIDHSGMRKALVRSKVNVLGGHLFDGGSILYLTRRLPEPVTVLDVLSREGHNYKMTIKSTETKIQMTDGAALQVLNIILKRAMDGLEMQLVGRNMYDAKSPVRIPKYKIDLWPGYITSIRQHEHNILVCCEVSHKVMRQETIYDIYRSHYDSRDRNPSWQDCFSREIIGSTVLTKYNNNTYQVSDVDYSKTPMDTFDQRGTPTSFYDYYCQRYQLEIRDRRQPLLISKPKARDIRDGRDKHIILIPELCTATGLTDKMRADFTMMRDLAEHTQMNPMKRSERLNAFANRLMNSEGSKSSLLSFGTKLNTSLIEVTGRQLPQDEIIFGNEVVVRNNDRVDWTNSLKSNQMYQCEPLKRWIVVCLKKHQRDVENFLNILREVAQGMRYEVGNYRMIEIENDRLPSYTKAIEEAISKDPKLIMVVVPNNAADRYSAIKRLTCVEKAIPTQVIMHKTMMPKKSGTAGVMSIATKVVIQINCKLGGAPWMIKFPMKGVMAIGFDVTHDTSDKSKSYGAFVASMDLKQIVRYFSAISPHTNGEEMSSNIENHLIQALRMYKDLHNSLPERIFFYRDGVGDGQIEYIFNNEVQNLNKKLEDVYKRFGGSASPKFAFIIVNKRLNTRFFSCQGTRYDNPIPGTVIDNIVTLPERYDFFLVSQSVRQGTVAPTSFNIIHDTSGLTPDKMQMLAYKMCHLYYNWSGTLRVPAVVQYAHKLAFLAGEFLHAAPNLDLKDKLFYL